MTIAITPMMMKLRIILGNLGIFIEPTSKAFAAKTSPTPRP
jgi:hypothetical protein